MISPPISPSEFKPTETEMSPDSMTMGRMSGSKTENKTEMGKSCYVIDCAKISKNVCHILFIRFKNIYIKKTSGTLQFIEKEN